MPPGYQPITLPGPSLGTPDITVGRKTKYAFNTKDPYPHINSKGKHVTTHGPDVIVYKDEPAQPGYPLTNPALFYRRDVMEMDFDGAPNAYAPKDSPLRRWAIDKFKDYVGPGWVQKADDEFPGLLVPVTSLTYPGADVRYCRAYCNALEIPFVVLNSCVLGLGRHHVPINKSDFCTVVYWGAGGMGTAIPVHGILADIGPPTSLGEASYAMFVQCGLREDYRPSPLTVDPPDPPPKNSGAGKHDHFVYVLYAGSGNGNARTIPEITSNGSQLFIDWGGMPRVHREFGPSIRHRSGSTRSV